MERRKRIDAIHDSLTKNAFAFLGRAAEDALKDDPSSLRFAVTHFAHGIELLLKARLIHEHWTLIFDRPDRASIHLLESGSFRSVSAGDSFDRVKRTTPEALPQELDCVSELFKMRNQVVHFFHAGIESAQDADSGIIRDGRILRYDESISDVASCFCRVWYLLSEVLTKKWGKYFSSYRIEIARISSLMHRLHPFLQQRYEAIEDELDEQSVAGKTVTECEGCGFEACLHRDVCEIIKLSRCLVCGASGAHAEVHCFNNDCRSVVSIGPGEEVDTACSACQSILPRDQTVQAIGERLNRDGGIEVARCSLCVLGWNPSPVYSMPDNSYICVNCFEEFETTTMCENCGETVAGELEASGFYGCPFCDGHKELDR